MKSILSVLFLFICIHAFSQADFDKRLLVKYSKSQLNDMALNQSDILNYWTFYLDNSYRVENIEPGKDLSHLPEITFKSAKSFNILEINESMLKTGNKYFKIKNKPQLLILDSSDEFSKKYNAYRAKI